MLQGVYMSFLIKFKHQIYCQGYENTWDTVLVRSAIDFDDACAQLRVKYDNAQYFKNMTV
jgi:hypothetical protein